MMVKLQQSYQECHWHFTDPLFAVTLLNGLQYFRAFSTTFLQLHYPSMPMLFFLHVSQTSLGLMFPLKMHQRHVLFLSEMSVPNQTVPPTTLPFGETSDFYKFRCILAKQHYLCCPCLFENSRSARLG